jgi:hypothetical protein
MSQNNYILNILDFFCKKKNINKKFFKNGMKCEPYIVNIPSVSYSIVMSVIQSAVDIPINLKSFIH